MRERATLWLVEGERWGWKKISFGHLCILLLMPWCWAGTFLVQICWDLPCWSPTVQARFLTHHWARDLAHEEALPRRKHSHTVLKNSTFSPQGQSEEENSMYSCHLYGRACLLPLVYIFWVWKGLAALFCSLPRGPPGRPRTGSVGLQLRPSWCSMGRAGKEPGHGCLGCNRRYPLAPLQSWKPTNMWSLWFWNMYF